MKKIFISIAIVILSASQIYSQVTQEWIARYNGPGNNSDEAHQIAVDGLGNVYVTGHSIGSGTAGDYGTVKYNSAGVQQWAARYNGPGNSFERAFSIAVDGSGNVYVTGRSTGIGTAYDYAAIKYNSSGDSLWVRRYNGPGNGDDEAHSIAVDGSGNVYVTGWNTGSGTNRDFATIKYNAGGIQQWVQRYNGPGNGDDEAFSIAVDGSGNVYVTGSSENVANYDYATIKYNSSGDSVWVRRYNGPGNDIDWANSIAIDISGNVYVTGYSTGNGTYQDYATIKYSSSGVQQWVERYNGLGNDNDWSTSIAVDASGNVYVTGQTIGNGTSNDYTTIKYNSSGVQQWVESYNGPGNSIDEAASIAVDGSGNVYVTGISAPNYATIKYSSSGVQQWVERYSGPGSGGNGANSIAVDGSGNVYVTGWSFGSGTGLDFATIKYSQTIGIQPVSNEIPNKFFLSQNYPNPFNPATNIEFSIPKSGFVNLTIYDAMGREIETLVNGELKQGTYKADWDASNFVSGVYFYKLSALDYSDTKKMILMK